MSRREVEDRVLASLGTYNLFDAQYLVDLFFYYKGIPYCIDYDKEAEFWL